MLSRSKLNSTIRHRYTGGMDAVRRSNRPRREEERTPATRGRNRSMSEENPLVADEGRSHRSSGSWRSEWESIALLVFLYLLQGIPLGMGAAFVMFLQNHGITYSQQALFSLATWPFSLKFLWAPIVDSVYIKSFGRRKSWLVPVQYMIGFFLLALSYKLDTWFADEDTSPDVMTLTIVFFCLNFLAATQDIAVDGWALTMLSRRNVGHASTCNTVGQTAGYFLGHVVFLALESKRFANAYVYTDPGETGIVTMAGYMRFWSGVFFLTTTLVTVLKNEEEMPEEEQMSIKETYKLTKEILFLPPVLTLSAFLLTAKIGFAVADGATALKLMEAGVNKEDIALLVIPLVPLQIVLPFFISRHVTGTRPLDIFMKAYPWRLLYGIVLAWVVRWTVTLNGEFTVAYFAALVLVYASHQVLVNACYVSMMAFFARISDPAIGGTYMTLLNTLSNFGGNWPTTLAMWLLDLTTERTCTIDARGCKDNGVEEECVRDGGTCEVIRDGFYIQSFVFFTIGCLWLQFFGYRTANELQRLPLDAWAVKRRTPTVDHSGSLPSATTENENHALMME